MDIFKVCLFAICGVFALTVLKDHKSGLVLPASMLFGIVLITHTISIMSEQFVFLNKIINDTPFGEYGSFLLKIFGISLLTETTSDVCKEAGEGALASKVEMVGKAEMIVLSFPLIENILHIVNSLVM